MDADGLPLVGPGIDYTKVEAINQKRTIAFINHFVTHTSRFLNHFANVCEDKLEHLSGRLQQLEISLSMLEAKLSSIPGLESVTAPQSSSAATTTPADSAPASAPAPADPYASTANAPPPPPGAAPTPEQPAAPSEPPAEEAKSFTPVSQDPRYVKYFKMLQYGVPPPVVQGKMKLEGLDPNLLDTPDAPAPDGGVQETKDDSDSDTDSDASFSD